MTWQDGANWGGALGQYAMFAELFVMAALWIVGIVATSLFGNRRAQGEEPGGESD